MKNFLTSLLFLFFLSGAWAASPTIHQNDQTGSTTGGNDGSVRKAADIIAVPPQLENSKAPKPVQVDQGADFENALQKIIHLTAYEPVIPKDKKSPQSKKNPVAKKDKSLNCMQLGGSYQVFFSGESYQAPNSFYDVKKDDAHPDDKNPNLKKLPTSSPKVTYMLVPSKNASTMTAYAAQEYIMRPYIHSGYVRGPEDKDVYFDANQRIGAPRSVLVTAADVTNFCEGLVKIYDQLGLKPSVSEGRNVYSIKEIQTANKLKDSEDPYKNFKLIF